MRFEDAIPKLFQLEGGYVNNPLDRGGKTKYGISQRAYPNLDIPNLSKDQAVALYRKDYWDAIGADNLPENIRYLAFDTAVNHGVGAARKILATAGGDPNKIIEARKNIYNSMPEPQRKEFGKGWNNRLAAVGGSTGGAMSASSPAVNLTPYIEAGYEPIIEQAKQNGWTDVQIKEKLDADINGYKQIQSAIAQSVVVNDPMKTVAQLEQMGYSTIIREARRNGWSNEQIIEKIAPEAFAQGTAAKQAADKAGIVGNIIGGVGDTASDLWRGAKQIIATGDAEKRLKEEEEQERSNLERLARGETASGMIGRLGAYAPAALLPGANTIAGSALIGAGLGALQPTVEGENRLNNALIGGAVGGGAAAAFKGAGYALNKSGQLADDFIKYRNADPTSKEGQTLIARHITSKAGNTADKVDSAWVTQTSKIFDDAYENLYAGVTANLDDAAAKVINNDIQLGMIPRDYRRALTKLMYEGKDEAGNWIPRTSPIPVRDVVQLKRAVGRDLAGDGLNALKRDEMTKLATVLDDVTTSAFDKAGKGEAFAQVQEAYRHFKAARNMVKSSKDSGYIAPNDMFQGITKGRFGKQFEEGNAPFQDAFKVINELGGEETNALARAGAGLSKLLATPGVAQVVGIGKFVPGVRTTLAAAGAIMNAVGKNPAVRAAFLALDPVQQNSIRQIAAQSVTNTVAPTAAAAASAEVPKRSQFIKKALETKQPAPPQAAPQPAPSKLDFLKKRIGDVEAGEETVVPNQAQQVNRPSAVPTEKAPRANSPSAIPQENLTLERLAQLKANSAEKRIVEYSWDDDMKAYIVRRANGQEEILNETSLKSMIGKTPKKEGEKL